MGRGMQMTVMESQGREPPSHFRVCCRFSLPYSKVLYRFSFPVVSSLKANASCLGPFRIWFNHIYSFILMISWQRRHYFQDVSYLC